MFSIKRKVHVYETDLMGIVHHSNYLRFCEEARVEWCRQNSVLGANPNDVFGLTVLETKVKHVSPARYPDVLDIFVRTKIVGARMIFQYKLVILEKVACLAETIHCNMDTHFRVKRLNPELVKKVEKEVWTETWL